MKYPKAPIMMNKRKCNCILFYSIVYLVGYEQDLLHGIDGLGHGIIIVPVNGNFLLKIYDTSHTPKGASQAESYMNCIKPMMELAQVMLKN